jgi:hypothetical protein
MATVHVITRNGEVMGGWASKKDADGLAACDPSLKVTEIAVDGVLYWLTLPAAQRLAPRGTITQDDVPEIRREIRRRGIPELFADIVGQQGRENLKAARRRNSRPKLKALPGCGGGGQPEPDRAPVHSLPTIAGQASKRARRRGLVGSMPPGPA